MAQTPKQQRRHLPKLSPERLKLIRQAVDKTPRLSPAGRRAVMRSLEAAATGSAESVEVVIASLPKERKETVLSHVKQFMDFSSTISKRGREKLVALSEDEWQRLIDEAANASE